MIAPIYIPSKGRGDCCMTAKFLKRIGIPFSIIVEAQDVPDYTVNGWGPHLLVLPPEFKEKYEYCDALGMTVSTGSGPARNFALEHAKQNGFAWQWTIDDNISTFHYKTKNEQKSCAEVFRADKNNFLEASASLFASFDNVLMGGLEYASFAFEDNVPFVFNRRIFSCNCIRTDMPFRWRGRYNEDVILSLDILKAGYCTILLKKFNCVKLATQKLKGGNTDTVYKHGTRAKSELVCRVHNDCVFPDLRTIKRGTREHHKIDYSQIQLSNPIFNNAKKLVKLGRIEDEANGQKS